MLICNFLQLCRVLQLKNEKRLLKGGIAMPKEVHEDFNSLYNQMKRYKMNPDEVQSFFNENGIDINIKKQTGLENVLRMGTSSRLDLNYNEPNEFFFGDRDMTKVPTGSHTYTNWQYYIYQFVNQLSEPADKKQARIYVYKKGEKYPRELSYDKKAKTMTLSEPVNVSLKPPKKPSAYGWKNFFKNFSERYRRELEDYNNQLKKYNERKKFFENPAAARQQRWREEQNKNAEKQFITEDVYKSTTVNPAINFVNRELDNRFGAIEAKTTNTFERFDYVIIGGKTLRQLMMENISFPKFDENGNPTFDAKDIDAYQEKTPEQLKEMANDIIVKAMLQGVPVKAAKLDPVTGEMLPDENGKMFTELPVPAELKKLEVGSDGRAAVDRIMFGRIGINLAPDTDSKELLRQTDTTCKNIQALNKAAMVLSSTSGYTSMSNSLLGGWAKDNGFKSAFEGLKTVKSYDQFTSDRSCIPSHAIAYLISQGHSLKDISDPSKLAKEKDAAGREAMKRYLDHDKKWMAEVNVKAQQKIVDETDAALKNVNFNDNNSVFTKDTIPCFSMVYTMFDLQQEKDHMKQEVIEAVAKQNGLDTAKPDEMKKAQELSNKLTVRVQALSTAKQLVTETRSAANLTMGNVNGYSEKVSSILSGQVCRVKYAEAQSQGKPVSEFADLKTSTVSVASGGFIIMNDEAKNHLAPGSIAKFAKQNDSYTALREFGNNSTSGAFKDKFDINISVDNTGIHTVFEKKEQQPAIEAQSPSKVLQGKKDEPEIGVNAK